MDTTVKEHESESVQRWTTKRKAALVLSILKGETSIEEAARRNGLTVGEIEDWRDRFLLGAENALKIRPRDEEALKDEQIKRLKQKIGEMVLDIDIMKEAMKPYRPTTPGTSDEQKMALPGASVRRICMLLLVARSSLNTPVVGRRATRRPVNARLVDRIRELIKQHPTFGYRRLWAMLRFRDGISVNHKTVYRVLRQNRWFVHQRNATPRPRVHGWC